MIFAKKAQIIVLDTLIFIILIILVISLEIGILDSYKENLNYEESKIDLLKQDFLIDYYLLDCNYLGYFNNNTKKCYKNKIEIKNKDRIYNDFCKITIDDKEIIDRRQPITSTHKRGVVYKNKFSIMEVSFCEK